MHATFRPITGPDELPLFLQLTYDLDDEVADDLERGNRRPEWIWIAEHDGTVVARAAWWSRPGASEPYLMDFFDFADGHAETAETLVRTAMEKVVPHGSVPPEYLRFIPPDWQRDPAAVQQRMAVLERLGARLLVERLRLEWRPGTPVAPDDGRLRFRGFTGAEEALELMTRTVEGTLDAHNRADLTRMSPRAVAEEHFHGELERWPSPQEWWRVGTRPDGEPVGFVFPARNDYGPIIAYIGVLPGHRGHGYIDAILAEGTRVLAAHDIPRIRANTDVGNVPMARAFARHGYVNYQNQIDMTWAPSVAG
ncbi:GNAT family N-acetyltransferase [Dactylosporangium sp. NPDC049140]|uniref:GNAT family N-acetyltransferase n=1 Tax=Dactylosporangium sp. NPDC049140 TaxID=3155647 RepID=UPI0033D87EF6